MTKSSFLKQYEYKDSKTLEFISKAFDKKYIEKNETQYEYHNSIYLTAKEKIIITCKKHGDFEIRANMFLHSQGCKECGKLKSSNTSRRLTQEDFIERAKKVHNNFYDYSKTIFTTTKNKVIITCPKHGDFEQLANNHLMGQNCLKCVNESKLKTTQQFIIEANKIHNNFYDYSKTIYTHSENKIIITCPKHGDFEQLAHHHLSGSICKKCALDNSKIKNTKTTEYFIERAKKIHGDKYDYSKTVYTHSESKVIITCPKHGDFEQQANQHLSGVDCYKCANNILTQEDFISKAKEKHGDKYDYSKTIFKLSYKKVIITCPEHGDFEQQAIKHLSGQGCNICANLSLRSNTEDFISKAKEKHGDKYEYDKVDYKLAKEKVIITCPKHGDFEQKPNTHLTGRGCPVCGKSKQSSVSKAEKEIYELLSNFYTKENMITINKSDREILYPNELDLYIPDLKVGIEFNGLYWHSDVFRDSKYHLNKLEQAKEKGIRLIQIFEDEWHNKREIVESRLKHILSKTETKYYARKCYVKEINPTITKIFLNNNHIQGAVQSSSINLGLFDKETDLLISVMTFGKLRVSLGNKFSNTNEYELLRFCNKLNSTVVGGANKLLKYFENKYKPKSIISYADKRWSNGGVYFQLGFEHTHDSEPNYYYVDGFERRNRFSFRKDILVSKYGCPENMTEREFCREVLGMNRIYDCGNMVFRKTYVK